MNNADLLWKKLWKTLESLGRVRVWKFCDLDNFFQLFSEIFDIFDDFYISPLVFTFLIGQVQSIFSQNLGCLSLKMRDFRQILRGFVIEMRDLMCFLRGLM